MATATPCEVQAHRLSSRPLTIAWFLLATVVALVSLSGRASAEEEPAVPAASAMAAASERDGHAAGKASTDRPPAPKGAPEVGGGERRAEPAPTDGRDRPREAAPRSTAPPSPEPPPAPAPAPAPAPSEVATEREARPHAAARLTLANAAAVPGDASRSEPSAHPGEPTSTGSGSGRRPVAEPTGSAMVTGAVEPGTTGTTGERPPAAAAAPTSGGPDLSLATASPGAPRPALASEGPPTDPRDTAMEAPGGPRLSFATPTDGLLGISLTSQLPVLPGPSRAAERTTAGASPPPSDDISPAGGGDPSTAANTGRSPGSVAITTGEAGGPSARAGSPNHIEPGSATASAVALILLVQAAFIVARRTTRAPRRRLVAVSGGGQIRDNAVMGAVSGAGPPNAADDPIRSASLNPSTIARIDVPTTARTTSTTSIISPGAVASDATAKSLKLSRGTETGSRSSSGFHLLRASAVADRDPALLPRPVDQLGALAALPGGGERQPVAPRDRALAVVSAGAVRERGPPLFGTSRLPYSSGRDPPER